MSKYIIEIPDDTRRIWIDVFGEGYCYTQAKSVDDLEELNSDYINEHFGELQDEAYQKGFEDGKKSVSEPDRIEVGDEVRAEEGHVFVVTGITDKGSIYGFDKDGMWLVRVKDRLRKTSKHYDIASILEAMRK